MRLSERLEHLVTQEHASLRQTLSETDSALEALLERRRRAFEPVETRDMFGNRVQTPAAAPDRELTALDPAELRQLWARYRQGVDAWLDGVAADLQPAVRRWDQGESEALDEARAQVAALQARREQVEQLTAPLRRHARFVRPLQQALRPLLQQVEAAGRAEDVELVPAILAGSRETSETAASISGRYRTSDDVARTLRQRLPEAAPEPEPEPGLLGRLKRLFGS